MLRKDAEKLIPLYLRRPLLSLDGGPGFLTGYQNRQKAERLVRLGLAVILSRGKDDTIVMLTDRGVQAKAALSE